VTASQATNDRSGYLACNSLHRLEVAGRGDGEAGLDDVHAEVLERLSHFQLLGKVHAGPRGLLAVPQRGIENDQTVVLRHGRLPWNKKSPGTSQVPGPISAIQCILNYGVPRT